MSHLLMLSYEELIFRKHQHTFFIQHFFLSFVNNEMAQVLEIHPHIKNDGVFISVYSTP